MFKKRWSTQTASIQVGPAGKVTKAGVWPPLVAALLWLTAALCTGYWVLQWLGRAPLTPVAALVGNPLQADVKLVARALGAVPQAAPAAPAPRTLASRFRLLGVVGQPGERGSALIAVDGQPPKPVTLGSEVDAGLRLLSVQQRAVRLGTQKAGEADVELQLPETER